MRVVAFAALVSLAACGPPSTIPLLTAAGVPLTTTPPSDIPLEVITRGTGVRDPLPVDGARASYADLETALGHAVSSAATHWAENHRIRRPEGWQLTVELIQSDAQYRAGRMVVSMGVRATLRTRFGRTYIAQTQAHWREGALLKPDEAAPLFFACMMHIGRDLTGWLGAIEP